MVIVDTSAWIPALRQHTSPESFPQIRVVDGLLAAGHIAMVGPILTELLRGARTEAELDWLHEHLTALPFLPTPQEVWVYAGRQLAQLRKRGVTVGLVDMVIATVAVEGNHEVYTLDADFQQIPGVRLYEPIS